MENCSQNPSGPTNRWQHPNHDILMEGVANGLLGTRVLAKNIYTFDIIHELKCTVRVLGTFLTVNL